MNEKLYTAFLCNTVNDGFRYFPPEAIKEIHSSTREIKLKDGRQFIIVTCREHTNGMEFDTLLIHPLYTDSLVRAVKSRIR